MKFIFSALFFRCPYSTPGYVPDSTCQVPVLQPRVGSEMHFKRHDFAQRRELLWRLIVNLIIIYRRLTVHRRQCTRYTCKTG